MWLLVLPLVAICSRFPAVAQATDEAYAITPKVYCGGTCDFGPINIQGKDGNPKMPDALKVWACTLTPPATPASLPSRGSC